MPISFEIDAKAGQVRTHATGVVPQSIGVFRTPEEAEAWLAAEPPSEA